MTGRESSVQRCIWPECLDEGAMCNVKCPGGEPRPLREEKPQPSATPRTDALANVPIPSGVGFDDWHVRKYRDLSRNLERAVAELQQLYGAACKQLQARGDKSVSLVSAKQERLGDYWLVPADLARRLAECGDSEATWELRKLIGAPDKTASDKGQG